MFIVGIFDIEVTQSADATIAFVYLNGERIGEGTAKRHPNDKNDPAIGETLAVSRALADAISFVDSLS